MAAEMRMKLPGVEGLKVAITAGGSGIGRCIARALAEQGAQLAICDVDRDAIELSADETGVSVAEIADVSDENEVARFVKRIAATQQTVTKMRRRSAPSPMETKVPTLKSAQKHTSILFKTRSAFLHRRASVCSLQGPCFSHVDILAEEHRFASPNGEIRTAPDILKGTVLVLILASGAWRRG